MISESTRCLVTRDLDIADANERTSCREGTTKKATVRKLRSSRNKKKNSYDTFYSAIIIERPCYRNLIISSCQNETVNKVHRYSIEAKRAFDTFRTTPASKPVVILRLTNPSRRRSRALREESSTTPRRNEKRKKRENRLPLEESYIRVR